MSPSPAHAPRRAVVIRHVAFEDLGSFARPLAERGCLVQYLEAGVDALEPAADAELVVLLGGPIGAGDERQYPFLIDEIRLIERRLAADRATLGICLGAQLMARALGARVYASGRKEIGWGLLSLSEAGAASPLEALAPRHTPVLHWHGDTFDLPRGALHLAATAACENQAFGWSQRALALQFHPEVTAAGLERWFIGHTLELAATPDVSVERLRDATRRFAPALERRGPEFLRRWLALAFPAR